MNKIFIPETSNHQFQDLLENSSITQTVVIALIKNELYEAVTLLSYFIILGK